MTDDLVQFLRARLDEDEAAARLAAEPESWMQLNRQPRPNWYVQLWADPDVAAVVADPESSAYPVVATPTGMEANDAEARTAHIVRHDPARVLAEVDAKRRLLTVHQRDTSYSFSGCITCDAGDNSCGCMGGSAYDYPCETLRVLALPYADHPDYREEWKL